MWILIQLMDLQDHLSIGLLGECLFNLSKPSPIRRKKIPMVHQGRPSLSVCGEDEILPTVVSMYMTDSEQRLPSRSEVLVCSEETTKCDIERFVRRAMLPCETKGIWFECCVAESVTQCNPIVYVFEIFCVFNVRLDLKIQSFGLRICSSLSFLMGSDGDGFGDLDYSIWHIVI